MQLHPRAEHTHTEIEQDLVDGCAETVHVFNRTPTNRTREEFTFWLLCCVAWPRVRTFYYYFAARRRNAAEQRNYVSICAVWRRNCTKHERLLRSAVVAGFWPASLRCCVKPQTECLFGGNNKPQSARHAMHPAALSPVDLCATCLSHSIAPPRVPFTPRLGHVYSESPPPANSLRILSNS